MSLRFCSWNSGLRSLDCGLWLLVLNFGLGLWASDLGFGILDVALWALDFGIFVF